MRESKSLAVAAAVKLDPSRSEAIRAEIEEKVKSRLKKWLKQKLVKNIPPADSFFRKAGGIFMFHTYMLLQIFTVFPFRKRIFQAEHSGP